MPWFQPDHFHPGIRYTHSSSAPTSLLSSLSSSLSSFLVLLLPPPITPSFAVIIFVSIYLDPIPFLSKYVPHHLTIILSPCLPPIQYLSSNPPSSSLHHHLQPITKFFQTITSFPIERSLILSVPLSSTILPYSILLSICFVLCSLLTPYATIISHIFMHLKFHHRLLFPFVLSSSLLTLYILPLSSPNTLHPYLPPQHNTLHPLRFMGRHHEALGRVQEWLHRNHGARVWRVSRSIQTWR